MRKLSVLLLVLMMSLLAARSDSGTVSAPSPPAPPQEPATPQAPEREISESPATAMPADTPEPAVVVGTPALTEISVAKPTRIPVPIRKPRRADATSRRIQEEFLQDYKDNIDPRIQDLLKACNEGTCEAEEDCRLLFKYLGETAAQLDDRLYFQHNALKEFTEIMKDKHYELMALLSHRFMTGGPIYIAPETSSADIFAKVRRSIPAVLTEHGIGSGFVIDPEGLLVTNFHVVRFPQTPRSRETIYNIYGTPFPSPTPAPQFYPEVQIRFDNGCVYQGEVVPRQLFLPDASIDFAALTPSLTVDSALRR